MVRSRWKGPYISIRIKNLENVTLTKDLDVEIMPRNSEIPPECVGSSFKVSNGKNESKLIVTDYMIGHKFGEFVFTRKKFVFKKKKNKNHEQKKNKKKS